MSFNDFKGDFVGTKFVRPGFEPSDSWSLQQGKKAYKTIRID